MTSIEIGFEIVLKSIESQKKDRKEEDLSHYCNHFNLRIIGKEISPFEIRRKKKS